MNKSKKFCTKHMKSANMLASFALVFSIMAANTKCMCIFHQPNKPESLKDLRKF